MAPAPRLISMHRFDGDARIRRKDCGSFPTRSANLLIAFNSSRVAQPVLVPEPDPGTPAARSTPSDWAKDVRQ
jgi:hypothetical protein